jgi:hypothetical protein
MSLSKVRLKENIGIVAGEASISKFKFFLTPLKNIVNRIGDYVLIDHPVYGDQCPVLAIIKNIENFEEVIGATLGEKSVQTMAVGHVLGYMDLREATKTGIMPVRQMLVPVCPGTRVYLPYHNFLQAIFSLSYTLFTWVSTSSPQMMSMAYYGISISIMMSLNYAINTRY